MKKGQRLSTPYRNVLLAWSLALIACGSNLRADEELLENLLENAPPLPSPAATEPATQPAEEKTFAIPAYARPAAIVLHNGDTFHGPTWSTFGKPLRLYNEETRVYRDIDWVTIRSVEVIVHNATMEPDWRWLKEGSDEKVYSGRHYPLIDLAYRITLTNDQELEGTVVAPIYLYDGKTLKRLTLYKKYKGSLDETLVNVTYIQKIAFDSTPNTTQPAIQTTRKLPLIED